MPDPQIAAQIKGYSWKDRLETARALGTEASEEEKKELIEAVSGGALPLPSSEANDKLWLTIIRVFSGVLGLTALVLSIGMFVDAKGSVKPELIFSLFTSVAGFLAGLLAPNPFTKDKE